jgi:hypothetical protein
MVLQGSQIMSIDLSCIRPNNLPIIPVIWGGPSKIEKFAPAGGIWKLFEKQGLQGPLYQEITGGI